jgi:hypothetical protein
MKGYPTEQAALASVRLTTPTVVKIPALVPYIQGQLEYLEMIDDSDLQGIIHDPVTINGRSTGQKIPLLYTYNQESQAETLWELPSDADVSISAGHIIQVDLSGRPPDGVPHPSVPREIQERPSGTGNLAETHAQIPEVIRSTADSISSGIHSNYSSAEERKRSKDRLRLLSIPPLPLATKDLHQWVQNLPWQLSGQHWCHDGIHACDLLETRPETISP